jgi:DNA-binding CsgD family transcriptional regulator
VEEGPGRAPLDAQRGAIAVLDLVGNVTWADEAWLADDGEAGLPVTPIGSNLLQAYRDDGDPRAQTVANAIVAVFEGRATYFEIEHRASRQSQRSFLTSVAALRGDGAGAVVIQRAVSGRGSPERPRVVDIRSRNGAPIDAAIDRLTPREREVLHFMAAGLDNRAIAAKLGIQYTTVRGHIRSVIEKLDARSRLEAVARAYQNGWVEKK